MSTYGLRDRIPFGKHSGDTVKYVIDTDKSYFFWLLKERPQGIYFTREAYDYARNGSASNGSSNARKSIRAYTDVKEDEYKRLLKICKNEGLNSPLELSDFITENEIGRRFPWLAGDVEFDGEFVLENGIAPKVYARLCSDLDFDGPWSDKRVTDYTPNYYKYNR